MAKDKANQDTRTPEEKQIHQNLLQAGLNFYNISGIGDTSQMQQQAKMLEGYATSQGLDIERDLNGLTRQVGLFGELVPKEQESARKKLIELTTQNFDYALGGLSNQKAVGLAARLGITESEIKLEQVLSSPGAKLKDVKEAFSKMYEPSSLVQNYIALNDNPNEVASAAYGALERSNNRRVSEYAYMKSKTEVVYDGRKAKTYITENIEKANEKIGDEVRMSIGSNLASVVIARENERAKKEAEAQAKNKSN